LCVCGRRISELYRSEATQTQPTSRSSVAAPNGSSVCFSLWPDCDITVRKGVLPFLRPRSVYSKLNLKLNRFSALRAFGQKHSTPPCVNPRDRCCARLRTWPYRVIRSWTTRSASGFGTTNAPAPPAKSWTPSGHRTGTRKIGQSINTKLS